MDVKMPIVEACIDCGRVAKGNVCAVYLYPDKKWRLGRCNMATHVVETQEEKTRRRVGQQKSKRNRRKG